MYVNCKYYRPTHVPLSVELHLVCMNLLVYSENT